MQMRPAERIWLPGQGVVDLGPMKIHRALQAYDERLIFGRINDESHPGYGDWVAFVKMPHGQNPVPVIGFGKEMPTPEEAVARCDRANTRKHNDTLLRMIKEDDERRRAAIDKEFEKLQEVYVDIMKEAKGHKAPQIYVPRSI